MLNGALLGAWYISDNVTNGFSDVEELISQLNMTKTLADKIVSISLPPLSYVEELAKGINDSIVPDTQVQEILANATASHEAAQQALELARNARLVLMHCSSSVTIIMLLYNWMAQNRSGVILKFAIYNPWTRAYFKMCFSGEIP